MVKENKKVRPKPYRNSSASRARTYDIMINSHALCQLSYGGININA